MVWVSDCESCGFAFGGRPCRRHRNLVRVCARVVRALDLPAAGFVGRMGRARSVPQGGGRAGIPAEISAGGGDGSRTSLRRWLRQHRRPSPGACGALSGPGPALRSVRSRATPAAASASAGRGTLPVDRECRGRCWRRLGGRRFWARTPVSGAVPPSARWAARPMRRSLCSRIHRPSAMTVTAWRVRGSLAGGLPMSKRFLVCAKSDRRRRRSRAQSAPNRQRSRPRGRSARLRHAKSGPR